MNFEIARYHHGSSNIFPFLLALIAECLNVEFHLEWDITLQHSQKTFLSAFVSIRIKITMEWLEFFYLVKPMLLTVILNSNEILHQ